MAIQWFPGHMHKARKEMAKVLPQIDVILEVLDARIPWSSENPMLADIGKQKPVLRVLTLKARVAMVVGIPNVGKSTLINKLTGRSIAKTGNEPAITKRQQLIKLTDAWALRDTPGVLWPKVDNIASGFRLAATGAVRDTAMDSAEVATYLLDYLNTAYPNRLKDRYSNDLPVTDSVQTLEEIGRLRGCLGSGGLVDFDRAGRLLLQEYRQGLLGGITLETPDMRVQEIAETNARLQRIEEKREKRKKDKQAARKAAQARKKNG